MHNKSFSNHGVTFFHKIAKKTKTIASKSRGGFCEGDTSEESKTKRNDSAKLKRLDRWNEWRPKIIKFNIPLYNLLPMKTPWNRPNKSNACCSPLLSMRHVGWPAHLIRLVWISHNFPRFIQPSVETLGSSIDRAIYESIPKGMVVCINGNQYIKLEFYYLRSDIHAICHSSRLWEIIHQISRYTTTREEKVTIIFFSWNKPNLTAENRIQKSATLLKECSPSDSIHHLPGIQSSSMKMALQFSFLPVVLIPCLSSFQ